MYQPLDIMQAWPQLQKQLPPSSHVIQLTVIFNFLSSLQGEKIILTHPPPPPFHPHSPSRYGGEIWKRRFHSENAENVFRPH